jgi:hypothetical protein
VQVPKEIIHNKPAVSRCPVKYTPSCILTHTTDLSGSPYTLPPGKGCNNITDDLRSQMKMKKRCCPVGTKSLTTGLAPEKRGLMSPIMGTCSNITLSSHTIIPAAFIGTEVFTKIQFLHRLVLLSISSNLWSLTYISAISNDLRTTRKIRHVKNTSQAQS